MSTHVITLTADRAPASGPIERFVRPFQEFAAREACGGILLLVATMIAFVWVNSRWAASYFAFWHFTITLAVGGSTFGRDLHFWVDDGLMPRMWCRECVPVNVVRPLTWYNSRVIGSN